MLRSNLIGSFLTTKHFAPLIIRGGGGRIIYVSSIAGVQAGRSSLRRLEGCPQHPDQRRPPKNSPITASGPSPWPPGLTYTPGMRAIVRDEHIERVAVNYPAGRIGQPEDSSR